MPRYPALALEISQVALTGWQPLVFERNEFHVAVPVVMNQ